MVEIKRLKYISYLLIAVFILVGVALVLYSLSYLKKSTLQQVEKSLTTVLSTVQEAHITWIEQRRKEIHAYASRKDVIAYTSQLVDMHNNQQQIIDSLPLREVRKIFRQYLTLNNDQGFFLIAPDYTSIASMRDVNIGTPNLIYTQKQALLNRSFHGDTVFIPPIVSDLHPLQGKNTPTLFITTPVINNNGATVAVLAIRIDPTKDFTRITQLGRIGYSGETYAFDKQATLITNSRFDDTLLAAGLIGEQESSILNINITDPGKNLVNQPGKAFTQQGLPLTKMALSAINGYNDSDLIGYRDYRGVTVVGAWRWVDEYNFGITTEMDLSEALKPYINTRDTMVIVIGLISFLGLVLFGYIRHIDKVTTRMLSRNNAKLEKSVKTRTQELEAAQKQLTEKNKALKILATTDGLTGLYNRRFFNTNIEMEWRRCVRESNSMAIILFDIDFFKEFNDCYGHQKGDECLQQVAQAVTSLKIDKRPGDFIARYGGEEFVVCLSDTSPGFSKYVANNLLEKIAELQIEHERSNLNGINYVTVSVGAAVIEASSNISYQQLFEQADVALYKAKSQGRNRVCFFEQGDVA